QVALDAGWRMTGRNIVALGALLAGAAVALGAFGAHGLRSRITPEALAIYETAVRYHFYHALAIVLAGVLAIQAGSSSSVSSRSFGTVALCFVAGIALFSGSLYALMLTGMRWLGAITPLGGVLFLAGWGLFARAALRG